MIELLKLCGFSEREIKLESARVEKAFNKLGINAGDIERGKQRLTMYYDVELEGVRKLFRLYMREMVATLLARDEGKDKVIYGWMAPSFDVIGSAIMSSYKEVFVAYLSDIFFIILGGIFNKMVPILEVAEKKWLKAGAVAHCANVKAPLGLIASGQLPKPDLIVTSGFLCEAAPKTLDLFHEVYDLPICCWDTCMDREAGEYSEASKRAVRLAARSKRVFTNMIQATLGIHVTDDMLWEVINARSRLNDAKSKVQGIIENSDPLPISANHVLLFGCTDALVLSPDSLREAIDAINTLCEEIQERADKGIGVVEKGAPRIMAAIAPNLSDPRLEHLVGEMGMAIVALSAIASSPVPYDEVPQDPYVKICMHLQRAFFSIPAKSIPSIIEACKRLKINGVLNRFHVGCRTVAGDALIIEKAIKKELGIPVLTLEWENFDPRVYNHEQYKRRLEVFKTMMTKSSG